jgi:RecA-family ATPase
LSTDDYGVLVGPKGVGKTFSLADLAVTVSLGEPWFGRFPTEQARALVLTSEDSRTRRWRRIDAIARWLGHDPSDLEGELFIHPLAFWAVADLDRLRAELDAIEPGLVLLDPAYRYMSGVRAQLFDMGAVLTPCRRCARAGALRCSSGTTTTAAKAPSARSAFGGRPTPVGASRRHGRGKTPSR